MKLTHYYCFIVFELMHPLARAEAIVKGEPGHKLSDCNLEREERGGGGGLLFSEQHRRKTINFLLCIDNNNNN